MTRITVLGGTGYAGSHIVAEALSRGHQVRVIARRTPEKPIEGAEYVVGDVLDPEVLSGTVEDTDVVVEALSPRGELAGKLVELDQQLASLAERAHVRLGIVGGAGSLLVAPGGPALAQTDGFPAEFQNEAGELADVLRDLRHSDPKLDWFFLSPAAGFGAFAPGEPTGKFRLGGDVLLTDDEGNSNISGADYAQAFVDEIENPTHRRQRFSVAY